MASTFGPQRAQGTVAKVNAQRRINTGAIAIGGSPVSATAGVPAERTLIVTGVARSGTSMVASVLREAGVFVGQFLREVVVEDAQILELLRTRNMPALRQLIGERNAAFPVWGFKLPNLHAHLRHDELALFRNPHLVLIYRDPVAVAVRGALSEHYNAIEAVAATCAAQDGLLHFMRRAGCPTLLLSYEKTLVTPQPVIDALLSFCGLAVPGDRRERLLGAVRPNRPEYLDIANSEFEGSVDGIRDGQLYGWCRQIDRMDPQRVEVLANGIVLQSALADRFREDLAHGGRGNGCHGFIADLTPYRLPADTVLRVRIRDRVLELSGSGRTLGALLERVAAG